MSEATLVLSQAIVTLTEVSDTSFIEIVNASVTLSDVFGVTLIRKTSFSSLYGLPNKDLPQKSVSLLKAITHSFSPGIV